MELVEKYRNKLDREGFLDSFVNYSEIAWSTAVFPGQGEDLGLAYAALGIAGESGEVAEKVKKFLRDRGTTKEITEEDLREFLRLELGDIMWYINALARQLNINLDEIAFANANKLLSRRERGTLHGSGDNR